MRAGKSFLSITIAYTQATAQSESLNVRVAAPDTKEAQGG